MVAVLRSAPQPKHAPHSIEAEQSVLGGLMIDNSKLDACGLRPSDFYRADHQLIFQTISDIVRELQQPCDFVTLSEHLRNNGKLEDAGGVAYLGSLAVDTYSIVNIVHYAEIVKERAVLREVIAYGIAAAEAGYQPDGRRPGEIISELMLGLDRLQRRRSSKVRRFDEVMDLAERAIAAAAEARKAGRLLGAPTGIPCVDRRTGGFVAPRYWLIAGRPSLGKSAFLNQGALNAARAGWPGYVASLELADEEIGHRARANWGGVNVTRLAFGAEAEREISAPAAAELGRLPLYLDTSSVLIDEIVAQIIACKVQHDIRWAAVDNLQLVEVSGNGRQSRNDELSLISRTLKKLTIKLGIAIVGVSHLGRAVEKDRRKPVLSDLKDSGTLEQDADIVMFLHSDDDDKNPSKRIQVGFPKNRGGRKGWCDETVVFHGATQRFEEQVGGPIDDGR